ncbi:Ribonuclease PH [Bienertia sinuspersici]
MKPTKRDLSKYKTKPNSLSTTMPTTRKRAPPPPHAPTPEPSLPPSSQPIFSWQNQSQNDLCTTLKSHRIKLTLCYSSDAAKELGVDDCLQQIAQKHGFSKILNLREFVYPDLVLEFLSSLEVLKKGDISFFIGGVKRHMSLNQEQLVLIHLSLFVRVGEKGFVAKQFWKAITGRSDWVVGFTKSFAFVNPVIRLLHRLLLQVFYPKGETGQVATNDFRMLWWFVHGDPATMGQLDFGRFLIAAFIWERDHNTGSITMGSFVTVFAKHFGVALPSSTVLAGHALLDGEGKDANKVLYANLPCPATHLSNPNALLFKPGDSYSPPTAAVEPSAKIDDLFAHQAYVPRDQSTLLGPTHPYSRMSRPEVFDPHTPPLAPVLTREFRLFIDCFASFSQVVIA